MTGEPTTFEMLLQFHREVVLPDMERLIDARLIPFQREVHSHFDAIHGRFDKLESALLSLRGSCEGA